MSANGYSELSEKAKEVVQNMVKFCVNRGYCMGQDEGMITFDGDAEKLPFRAELERFCKDSA